MRRALAAVALALLAGCSGISGVGVEPTTDTSTLTPVDVPERSTPVDVRRTTRTPEDLLAPGLTTEGVTDPFALADAHQSALSNQSYTKITHTSIIGPNGTLRVIHQVVAVDAGGRRYHLTETSESATGYPVSSLTPHLEIWYDDGPALFRLGEGENVSYRVGMTSSLEGPIGDITGDDRLVGLYGTVDQWSVEPVLGRDTALFVLESAEPPDDDVLKLPVLVDSPRDARFYLVMTGDGRVISHQLAYDASFEGIPVQVIRRVRYVKVGSTTVERPTWYDEAMRETTDDRRGDGESGS